MLLDEKMMWDGQGPVFLGKYDKAAGRPDMGNLVNVYQVGCGTSALTTSPKIETENINETCTGARAVLASRISSRELSVGLTAIQFDTRTLATAFYGTATAVAAGTVTDDTAQALILARLLIDGDGTVDLTAFATALTVTALPVYAVDPVDPAAGWRDSVAAPAVVLAHSARIAARAADLAGAAVKHLTLLAISAAAADAAGDGWAEKAVSPRPDDAAMLAEAVRLCHKGRQ